MLNKFLLLFSLIFLVGIGLAVYLPLVGAVKPTDQQFTEGYTLKFPPLDIIEQNQDFEFEFHVYNISNGLPIMEGITCYFHLYNDTRGKHQLEMTDSTASHNFDYSFDVMGENFTEPGVYAYVAQCNSSFYGGFVEQSFEVTPTGDLRGMSFFLVLVFAAIVIFMGGYFLEQDWALFLSGILWIVTGIYAMVYGFADLTDLYTRTIAGICWAIGVVSMSAGIINSWGGEKEE